MNSIKEQTQEEILNLIPSDAHGLVQVAPRVGKTKLGIDIIKRDKPKKVLWVTSDAKLRDKDLPEEFLKWKAKVQLRKTTFVCYDSLASMKGEFDLIILDEYQNVTKNNTEAFFQGTILTHRILGLSGTHPKDKEKTLVLKDLSLDILVKLDIEEAVERGLIADYRINVLTCETNNIDKNIKAGNKEKSWMQTERQAYQYITNNIHRQFYTIKRLRMIYDSPTKEAALIFLLSHLKGKSLVFCTTKLQAERVGVGYTYYSGKNDEALQKFVNGDSDKLFCVNKGGVGFTYKGIDNLIILQANSDNTGSTTQKLTRTLLEQGESYSGNIWIICLEDTQDSIWVSKSLESYNKDKIKYISLNDFKNGIEQRNINNTETV